MNFSKKNAEGIPLWHLVWKGTKVCTRRRVPCLHCGKHWAVHSPTGRMPIEQSRFTHAMECRPQPSDTPYQLSEIMHYEPDLSRWQPTPAYGFAGVQVGWKHKTIAICPGRGKAAICKNCGCWKEHHLPQIGGHGVAYGFWVDDHVPICCDNYAPLRKRIVSAVMESEWMKTQSLDGGKTMSRIELYREAHREGFQTWEQLQDALYGKGGYPKGTPMARIEFEAIE